MKLLKPIFILLSLLSLSAPSLAASPLYATWRSQTLEIAISMPSAPFTPELEKRLRTVVSKARQQHALSRGDTLILRFYDGLTFNRENCWCRVKLQKGGSLSDWWIKTPHSPEEPPWQQAIGMTQHLP